MCGLKEAPQMQICPNTFIHEYFYSCVIRRNAKCPFFLTINRSFTYWMKNWCHCQKLKE